MLKITRKVRCPNPYCACEAVVTQGRPIRRVSSTAAFICGCGSPMTEGWRRPVWLPSQGRRVRPQ